VYSLQTATTAQTIQTAALMLMLAVLFTVLLLLLLSLSSRLKTGSASAAEAVLPAHVCARLPECASWNVGPLTYSDSLFLFVFRDTESQPDSGHRVTGLPNL
jgi:hypothetical protein